MSTPTTGPRGEQSQGGLFGEGELPASDAAQWQRPRSGGAARVLHAQRDPVELRAVDLEATLALDHPARTVWAFVQSLDLAPLYARIKSVEGRAGAPAIDPAILVAVWLWATIDGVGSAREVDRLCERDDASQFDRARNAPVSASSRLPSLATFSRAAVAAAAVHGAVG